MLVVRLIVCLFLSKLCKQPNILMFCRFIKRKIVLSKRHFLVLTFKLPPIINSTFHDPSRLNATKVTENTQSLMRINKTLLAYQIINEQLKWSRIDVAPIKCRPLYYYRMEQSIGRLTKLFLILALLTRTHCTNDSIVYNVERTFNLSNSSIGDSCGKMLPSRDALFHLAVGSNSNILDSWMINGGTTPNYSHTFSSVISDFDVDYSTDQLVFYNQGHSVLQICSSLNQLGSCTEKGDATGVGQQVFSHGDDKVVLTHVSGFGFGDKVHFYNKDNELTESHNLAMTSSKGVFTPDRSKLIIWNEVTKVQIYQVSPFRLMHTYNGSQTSILSPNLTQSVSVSADSTQAIIQTDSYHPITVLNLTDYSTVGQFSFNGSIQQTYFVPNSSTILVVTSKAIHTLNSGDGSISLLANTSTTSSVYGPSTNYLFLCSSNSIQKVSLSNSSAPEITPNSTQTTAQQEPYDPLSDPEAVIELDMEGLQGQATAAVADGLASTTSVLDRVILFALSNPFTYYFLTFVNFFTLSSHYVLLNMPIPKQLYQYLSKFYQQINTNIIGRLWVLPFESPSQQGVTRQKLLSISLTTDLSTGQLSNFLMALFNVVLFQGISLLVKRLSRGNFIRKVLYQPQSEIIFGQYISLILPLTSPWVFFMSTSALNFPSQLNIILQRTILGVNFIFCIYYAFQLIDQKQKARLNKANKSMNSPINKIKKVVSLSDTLKPNPSKSCMHAARTKGTSKRNRKVVTFGSFLRKNSDQETQQRQVSSPYIFNQSTSSPIAEKALTLDPLNIAQVQIIQSLPKQVAVSIDPESMEAWYLAFCNFFYPLVLVTPYPEIALASLFCCNILGVYVASCLKQSRANKVLLSLYPLLLHICFCIFRMTTHNQVLIYAQLVCLLILFLGSIHHFLFMVFGFISAIYLHSKTHKKVTPVGDASLAEQNKLQVEYLSQQNVVTIGKKRWERLPAVFSEDNSSDLPPDGSSSKLKRSIRIKTVKDLGLVRKKTQAKIDGSK